MNLYLLSYITVCSVHQENINGETNIDHLISVDRDANITKNTVNPWMSIGQPALQMRLNRHIMKYLRVYNSWK